MYEVANINDVAVKKVNLTAPFSVGFAGIEAAVDKNSKIIWLCSPITRPEIMNIEDMEIILSNFPDNSDRQAYINFSCYRSFTNQLPDFPNLVVLQTLSKP
jgi:histidinol-phosphate aminotransferase